MKQPPPSYPKWVIVAIYSALPLACIRGPLRVLAISPHRSVPQAGPRGKVIHKDEPGLSCVSRVTTHTRLAQACTSICAAISHVKHGLRTTNVWRGTNKLYRAGIHHVFFVFFVCLWTTLLVECTSLPWAGRLFCIALIVHKEVIYSPPPYMYAYTLYIPCLC